MRFFSYFHVRVLEAAKMKYGWVLIGIACPKRHNIKLIKSSYYHYGVLVDTVLFNSNRSLLCPCLLVFMSRNTKFPTNYN